MLFAFVDGNGNCRKEIVESMLEKEVSVIAAHDSETQSFRYSQVACPPGYSVHDFRGREVWTRVWCRHPQVTLTLDQHPDFSIFGSAPNKVDLRRIPSCLIGGGADVPLERQHRHWQDPRYSSLVFPHTDSVPRIHGGHREGCSRAHQNAAELALQRYPDLPVLLLEDDAVMMENFEPVLSDIPADADVIWLGRSAGVHEGTPSPQFLLNPNAPFQRLIGFCQASHAVLLVTKLGKQSWRECCIRALTGEFNGSTDLACSMIGVTLCRQYVSARPLFFQTDYPATSLSLFNQVLAPP